MRLYEHPESGNSHKVRLLLSFLGLEYESVIVDLMTDEQHQEPFLSVNPRGEVPVLDDNGLILRDSMAILTYLANRYDTGRWLPHDPGEMAQVMEWLAFAASWVQYGVFTARAIVAFGITGNGVPFDLPGNVEEATLRSKKSLEILEKQLTNQDWLCGATPTIADVACFPYIALAPMGNISLAPYPAVQGWIARFKALPGYRDMPGLEDANYRKN
jgi:glutathione S-transferase